MRLRLVFVQLGIAFVIVLLSTATYALPVSFSQTQNITSDGQNFVFNFLGLPDSDGLGGLFEFYARGDYTDPNFETPTITLDLLGGSLKLNENGIVSNTIAGLSLGYNNTIPGGGGVDQILDFGFNLSGGILDNLLADSNITVNVDNSSSVDNQTSYNDFVRVGFNYNTNPVPEPTTMLLLGTGLLGLAGVRRRKK